jgi:hypothetical protein
MYLYVNEKGNINTVEKHLTFPMIKTNLVIALLLTFLSDMRRVALVLKGNNYYYLCLNL